MFRLRSGRVRHSALEGSHLHEGGAGGDRAVFAGIKFGNLLFLAGQIPIDPATNQLNTGSIEDQTKLVLENLRAVLTANGMTMDDVVSTSVFLKDLNDFARMNTLYATYFKDKPPARATVQVARLPRDVLVEISAIAAK